MFILFLLSIVNAEFLRECIYSDDSCKKIIGCEYSKLDACLVKSEGKPKDGYVIYNSYKATVKDGRVTYTTFSESNKCQCDEDDIIVDSSNLFIDKCVPIRDGAMYKISTVVESITGDEMKPIAYFVNSTYGFTNKPKCDQPTKLEALFNNCAQFPNGQSALYRIYNDHVICDLFHDDQCLKFQRRLFEHKCNTCISEKVDKGLFEYRAIMCGDDFLLPKKDIENKEKEL